MSANGLSIGDQKRRRAFPRLARQLWIYLLEQRHPIAIDRFAEMVAEGEARGLRQLECERERLLSEMPSRDLVRSMPIASVLPGWPGRISNDEWGALREYLAPYHGDSGSSD